MDYFLGCVEDRLHASLDLFSYLGGMDMDVLIHSRLVTTFLFTPITLLGL
jgi:hypothetical protein